MRLLFKLQVMHQGHEDVCAAHQACAFQLLVVAPAGEFGLLLRKLGPRHRRKQLLSCRHSPQETDTLQGDPPKQGHSLSIEDCVAKQFGMKWEHSHIRVVDGGMPLGNLHGHHRA